jgi:hypothetical protein
MPFTLMNVLVKTPRRESQYNYEKNESILPVIPDLPRRFRLPSYCECPAGTTDTIRV